MSTHNTAVVWQDPKEEEITPTPKSVRESTNESYEEYRNILKVNGALLKPPMQERLRSPYDTPADFSSTNSPAYQQSSQLSVQQTYQQRAFQPLSLPPTWIHQPIQQNYQHPSPLTVCPINLQTSLPPSSHLSWIQQPIQQSYQNPSSLGVQLPVRLVVQENMSIQNYSQIQKKKR